MGLGDSLLMLALKKGVSPVVSVSDIYRQDGGLYSITLDCTDPAEYHLIGFMVSFINWIVRNKVKTSELLSSVKAFLNRNES